MSGSAEEVRVEETLIQALHAKSWRATLDQLDMADIVTVDDQRLLTRARLATEGLDLRVAAGLSLVQTRLRSAGIATTTVEPEADLSGKGVVTIRRRDLADSVSVLMGEGFVPTYALSEGGQEAMGRLERRLTFVGPGDGLTSVTLRWGSPQNHRRFRSFFNPSLRDLIFISLPQRLWWAYWLVRPFRLVSQHSGVVDLPAPMAPFLGTPTGLIGPILDLVAPEAGSEIVDLGCGDGRVLIEAAKRLGCRGRGVDLDRRLVQLARASVIEQGLEEMITIEEGDAAEVTLDSAAVVFAFLPASIVVQLLPGILDRMKPGSVLVAHEQEAIRWPLHPDRSHLVACSGGITVAHVWRVS